MTGLVPGSGGDFNARLREALTQAKTPAARAATTADAPQESAVIQLRPTVASQPPPAVADDFSSRLASAMNVARTPEQDAIEAGDPARTGPVGQGDYLVRAGDCVASIAVGTGHFWETIWNDAANSQLREVREDPYILLPGDRVTIPELRRKDEPIEAERRHRFKRKGCPEKLIVHFREGGSPRVNQRYVLILDNQEHEGVTDPNGRVELFIPPDAKRGVVYFPDSEDAYELDLGHLDPVSETSGIQGRLRNLGYYDGPVDGRDSLQLEAGVRAFQAKQSLPASGQLDENGRRKLQEIHGS